LPTNLRVCVPTYLRFSGALCYGGYLARSILLLHGTVTGHQDPAWLAHFKAKGGERNELSLNLIMNMNRIVRSGINSSTPILLLDIPARRARHDMGLIACQQTTLQQIESLPQQQPAFPSLTSSSLHLRPSWWYSSHPIRSFQESLGCPCPPGRYLDQFRD